MSSVEPSAGEISVSETLALLLSQFKSTVAAIGARTFAFWLGSGISRGRLDNVGALVAKVLKHLQSNIDPNDPNCVFRKAFTEAVGLAKLSKLELERVDFEADITTWPCFDAIVDRLSGQYSDLLEVEVDGKEPDYLLWDVVDVPTTYGAGSTTPDLEHYCIAVLVLEGVLGEIVSANWDGLIERAVLELSAANAGVLSVDVSSADFRKPQGRARLLKFHGCAVIASEGVPGYRELLVGRSTQITQWPTDDAHAVMRAEMKTIAATKHTLMVGLSAQDHNIKHLFADAEKMLTWSWPDDPPAFLFAEDSLGADQVRILKLGYGDSYQGNASAISSASLVRAYAKPLLSALVIAVLMDKLAAYGDLRAFRGDPHFATSLRAGIEVLARNLASAVKTSATSSIARFISDMGRTISLFREGAPPSIAGSYSPLGSVPTHQIASDPAAGTSGLSEMALALAAIGNGVEDGSFRLTNTHHWDESVRPALSIVSAGVQSRVFFSSNSDAAIALQRNGVVDESDSSVVVVHSTNMPVTQQRYPAAPPGRTGHAYARHIDLAEIVESSSSYEEFRQKFRQEFAV